MNRRSDDTPTPEPEARVPKGIDPGASPFKAHEVEALPLTREERTLAREAVATANRERRALANATRPLTPASR